MATPVPEPLLSETMLLRAIVLDANAYLQEQETLRLLRGSHTKAASAVESAWFERRERALRARMAKMPIAAVTAVAVAGPGHAATGAESSSALVLPRERLFRLRHDVVGNPLWLLVPGMGRDNAIAARVHVAAADDEGTMVVEYASQYGLAGVPERYSIRLRDGDSGPAVTALAPLNVFMHVAVTVRNVLNTDTDRWMVLRVLARASRSDLAVADIQTHLGPMYGAFRGEDSDGSTLWLARYRYGEDAHAAGRVQSAPVLRLDAAAVSRAQARVKELESDDTAIRFIVA